MHKSYPRFTLTSFRKPVAMLVAYLTLVTPFAPVFAQAAKVKRTQSPATASPGSKPQSKGGTATASDKHIVLPAPGILTVATAPAITATKTDNVPSSTLVQPNGTINYTVVVSNSAGTADATGVSFTDTIDANTTLVGGSLAASPVALNDSYNATADTTFNQAAPGVLANDVDPLTGTNSGLTIVSYGQTTGNEQTTIGSSTTTAHGSVSLNADGSFAYIPNAAFQGTDTFKYKISHSGFTDIATVTIIVDAPPSVTSTSPVNGAVGVAIASTITVNFSETVNAASGFASINCSSNSVAYTPITASNTSSIVLTPTGGLPPGSDCTVTLDHTKITDTDTNDPPDQMAADYTFSFKVNPDAVDDTYPVTLVGNVSTDSSVIPYSVNTNDVSATAYTISAVQASNTVSGGKITTLSANGGNVVMTVATGKFTYNPPAGYTGNDTFTYTITRNDGGGSDTATVTIPISGMVWFIDNSASSCTTVSGGCGRLSNPFSTLAAFNSANGAADVPASHIFNPASGDSIFIYTGSGNYTGPLVLLASQKLVGQGATASLSTITGFSPPSGSPSFPSTGGTRPTLTVASGTDVTLNTGNTVRGLNINATGGTALGGTSFNNLALSDATVTANNSGGACTAAINLAQASGTAAINATFISVNASSCTNGIKMSGTSGPFTITGDGTAANNGSGGTISASTNEGVLMSTVGTISLGQMVVQNSGTDGISLNGATGFTLNRSNVTDSAGTASDDGVLVFNTSGTVSFTNDNVTNAPHNGVWVQNNNVNMTSFTMTNTAITCSSGQPCEPAPAGTIGNDAMLLEMKGTSVLGSGSITGSTFSGVRATGLQVQTTDTGQIGSATSGAIDSPAASHSFTVSTSTFTNDNQGMDFDQSQNSKIVFQVLNNATITGIHSNAINGFSGAAAGSSGYIVGNIDGNTIGTQGTKDSGSAIGAGIRFIVQGDATQGFARINNNTIREVPNAAGIIQLWSQNGRAVSGTGSAKFKVTNNTLVAPSGTNQSLGCGANVPCLLYGVWVLADEGNPACLVFTGNNIFDVAAAGGAYDVFLTERAGPPTGAQLTVETGAANQPEPAAVNFINSNNTLAGSASRTTDESSNVTTVTSCGGTIVATLQQLLRPNSSGAQLAQMCNAVEQNERGTLPALNTSGDTFPIPVGLAFAPRFDAPAAAAAADAPAQIAESSAKQIDGAGEIAAAASVAAVSAEARPAVASVSAPSEWSDIPAGHAHHAARTVNASYTRDSGTQAEGVRFANASYEYGDATTAPRASRRATPRAANAAATAAAAIYSGETVTVNGSGSGFTLPVGKSVTITFSVTVNPGLSSAVTSVSNQGSVTGTNFTSVNGKTGTPNTNDTENPGPSGSPNPTVTNLLTPPDISALDAKVGEPPTGQTNMVFVVKLNHAYPPNGTSVDYSTANGTATGGASCGGGTDYLTTNGTLTFGGSETVKTVSVPVCANGISSDKTLTLNLTVNGNTVGQLARAQATGTILANPAGTFLISEIRTSGPGAGPAGLGNDFVELYNNTDSPLTIPAGGYGVFKMGADCNALPVLVATIPAGTPIPARGHYLLVGSTYSLANYGGVGAAAGDQTLTSDLESDANVAVFSTADVNALSTANRLDAVGFGTNTGGNACDLLREGATLPAMNGSTLEYSYFRNMAGTGLPADTGDNSADFLFADTQATVVGSVQRLGAPGPENKTSPVNRGATIKSVLFDPAVSSSADPNRHRDSTAVTNGTNGTLVLRRTFNNNTGANVTRLRFRVVDMTAGPTSLPGTADLRLLSTTGGSTTITGGGSKSWVSMALDTTPSQPIGGGYNSTVVAIPGNSLPAGGSINIQFTLGVMQPGTFKFFVIVEGLP